MLFTEKIIEAQELLKQYLFTDKKVGLACSFGKDSMVLLDLCRKINPNISVFSLISDTEFPETIDFIENIVQTWSLNFINIHFNQKQLVENKLINCCDEEKVLAAKMAVRNLDIWISGVRKSESKTREKFESIEEHEGLIKVNPILNFTEQDVWRYLACYNVPINPLYQQGYRSLGCRICSSIERTADESERDGRWRNSKRQGGECGIHIEKLKLKEPK